MRSVEKTKQITHKTRVLTALGAFVLMVISIFATDAIAQLLIALFPEIVPPRLYLSVWVPAVLLPIAFLTGYQIAPPRSVARMFVAYFAFWYGVLMLYGYWRYVAENNTGHPWPYYFALFSFALFGIIHERDKTTTTIEEKLDR